MTEETKKDLTSIFELPTVNISEGTSETEAPLQETQPIVPLDPAEFGSMESFTQSNSQPEPIHTDQPNTSDLSEPSIASIDVTSAVTLTNSSSETPPQQDLSGVRQFAEKIAVGQPTLEANPPFTVMMYGPFSEEAKQTLAATLEADNYGISFSDIELQFSSEKLLIPQISEFAAVTLAQKMRTYASNILLGPAEEIFQNSEEFASSSGPLIDKDHYHQRKEQTLEHGTPKSSREVFTTNFNDLSSFGQSNFKVTKILGALSTSLELQDSSPEHYQKTAQELLNQLKEQAFQMGAHGVIGIYLQITQSLGPSVEKPQLVGTGTAVQCEF